MKETISLRMDAELMDFIRKAAEKDFRSVNNYIELILKKHMLEEQEGTEKPSE